MFKKTTLRAEIQDKHVLHRYSTTCVITLKAFILTSVTFMFFLMHGVPILDVNT